MTDAITRIRKIKEAGYTGPAVTTLLEICDRQAAEIERLRAESDERLKNTVAQAMEIERLKADAERYRWLRNKTPWTAVNAFNKTRIAFRLAAKFSEKESPKAGVNLDTAIDTAMKKTP